jgi:hypothetical protein
VNSLSARSQVTACLLELGVRSFYDQGRVAHLVEQARHRIRAGDDHMSMPLQRELDLAFGREFGRDDE